MYIRRLYFAVYKPFGYLSQFTPDIPGQLTLAHLYDFPPDVYPVGRLDKNSEGLLILTNDKTLTETLIHPSSKKLKVYWAQVEGVVAHESLVRLESGLRLRIKKREFTTAPAFARILETPAVEERNPPIRYRANIPTSWLEIKITEGKFHQVRKMCAAIGNPVLRLIRVKIAQYTLPSLSIGQVYDIPSKEEII